MKKMGWKGAVGGKYQQEKKGNQEMTKEERKTSTFKIMSRREMSHLQT